MLGDLDYKLCETALMELFATHTYPPQIYIHYYDVKLPPIYDWEKGYLCGTHPWPARQYMETEQQGWKEVYDIDKTIVENAAQHFDGAREFLKAIK